MRRKLIGVLVLSVMLLFSFASCSLDGILDATEGNKFNQTGNSSETAKDVKDIIRNSKPAAAKDAIRSESGSYKLDLGKVDGFSDLANAVGNFVNSDSSEGNTLYIDLSEKLSESIKNSGLLAPMTNDEKEVFVTKINMTLAASDGENTFAKEMNSQVPESVAAATKNTMALTESLLGQVIDQLNVEENDDLQKELKSTLENLKTQLKEKSVKDNSSVTYADVVQMQLVSNLVTTVSAVIPQDGQSLDFETMGDEIGLAIDDIRDISVTSQALLDGGIDALNLGSLSDLVQSFIDKAKESN